MRKNKNDIMPFVIGGGILIAYFGIIRPILKKLGVVSSEDTRLVNDVESLPASENPFNKDYFPTWEKTGQKGGALQELSTAGLKEAKACLDNGLGYLYDDEDAIYNCISVYCPSKIIVSQLSKYIYDTTGSELLAYLKAGKNPMNPASGLNDTELAKIIRMVQNKPKYTYKK